MSLFEKHCRIYREVQNDKFIIMSIDPGTDHFAIRIEERTENGKIIPMYFQKTEIKTMEKRMADPVDLFSYLDTLNDFFKLVTIILIEEQLILNLPHMRGGSSKSGMIRLCSWIIGYCLIKIPNASVYEISSKVKMRLEKTHKGEDIKKKSMIRGKEILIQGEDEQSLDFLCKLEKNKFEKHRRIHDLTDTICQIDGFIWLYNQR